MINTKVVVFGGEGMVGSRFIELQKDSFNIISPTFSELNLLEEDKVEKFLNTHKPAAIVNFAAYTNVDEAEKETGDFEGIVYKINALATKTLSRICKKMGIHLIHISTDYVFDGTKRDSPYTEKDNPNPLNWYGKTKYAGDKFIQESGCKYAIVRIEIPYTAHYELKKDLVRLFVDKLKNKEIIHGIYDQRITPILADDVVFALERIIQRKKEGVFHVVSCDWTTPFKFALLIAEAFGFDKSLVKKISLKKYMEGKDIKRPRNPWMFSKKFEKVFGKGILHTNKQSLEKFKSLFEIAN